MTKYMKKQTLRLRSLVLFSVLLISFLCSTLTSAVSATESGIDNKTLTILNEVIGLNTEKNVISSNLQQDNKYRGLAQKAVDTLIDSTDGPLLVSSSFINNNLRQIHISNTLGNSSNVAVSETVELAKDFLGRYQTFVKDSFYGELSSTLSNVDATKNTTKHIGNTKLQILNHNQKIVDYVWRYVDDNGIVARSKNVILTYEQGQLTLFLNNWPLYKIMNEPKISCEDATAIATEESKNFSYDISTENGTTKITGFEIAPKSLGHGTLSYLNNPDPNSARGEDPLTLYPSWYIPIGFNKSYPGGVTGMIVTVWADTGEVCGTNPMVVYFPSEASNEDRESIAVDEEESITDGLSQNSTILFIPIAITTTMGLFGIVCSIKKLKFVGNKKLLTRFGVALMCGILLFSVTLVAIPIKAEIPAVPDSKTRIYGALDGSEDPYSTAQLEDEKTAALAKYACYSIENCHPFD